MKKAKNIISEIKKYSKEKKFFLNNQKIRIQSESSLGTLARTFLSSLIIISIFFITPIIINFKNENKLFSSKVFRTLIFLFFKNFFIFKLLLPLLPQANNDIKDFVLLA